MKKKIYKFIFFYDKFLILQKTTQKNSMSTVVLKWNPSFSSCSMLSFLFDLRNSNTDDEDVEFNWSVW